MITKLEARNNRGGLLTLELEDVTDGIVLADVQGLDPVKATIVASSFAGEDGAQFHSAHLETRDLVIVLDLDPDDPSTSVRDLRNTLYLYFLPKSAVDLRLYDDSGLTVDISGIVEDMDAPLFVQEPQARIVVRCMKPDFINVIPSSLSASTTSGSDTELLTYDGTANVGFVFTMDVDRTLSQFTIYHTTPAGSVNQMLVSVDLVAGDTITISTVEGSKYAHLTRASVISSVLYGVSTQAVYHQLENGANYIRVAASGAAIPYTIDWVEKYGGM